MGQFSSYCFVRRFLKSYLLETQAMPQHRPVLSSQREKCLDPDEIYLSSYANCNLSCLEKLEDKGQNVRLSKNSRVVVLTLSARMAVPSEEAIEVDTPLALRVAIPRRHYWDKFLARGEGSSHCGLGEHPLDSQILPQLKKHF